MDSRVTKLFLIAGAVAVVSCIYPPTTQPPAVRDIYFHAPPERIWDALLVVVTDAGAPIENMDRLSWFFRSQPMRIASEDTSAVDCGHDSFGRSVPVAGVAGRFTVLLRPSGDSTGVRLQLSIEPEGCVSRGKVEQRILARLATQLGVAKLLRSPGG